MGINRNPPGGTKRVKAKNRSKELKPHKAALSPSWQERDVPHKHFIKLVDLEEEAPSNENADHYFQKHPEVCVANHDTPWIGVSLAKG